MKQFCNSEKNYESSKEEKAFESLQLSLYLMHMFSGMTSIKSLQYNPSIMTWLITTNGNGTI
uniref:Uncharacterized protein n=1 Tax=Salix viminalis TaxID=40686 RepID=A0A6N2ME71_SALVM